MNKEYIEIENKLMEEARKQPPTIFGLMKALHYQGIALMVMYQDIKEKENEK